MYITTGEYFEKRITVVFYYMYKNKFGMLYKKSMDTRANRCGDLNMKKEQ